MVRIYVHISLGTNRRATRIKALFFDSGNTKRFLHSKEGTPLNIWLVYIIHPYISYTHIYYTPVYIIHPYISYTLIYHTPVYIIHPYLSYTHIYHTPSSSLEWDFQGMTQHWQNVGFTIWNILRQTRLCSQSIDQTRTWTFYKM